MMQIGGYFDLAREALSTQYSSQLGPQNFDGHLPLVLEVLGEVHRGHAAFAEVGLDAVAVRERGGRVCRSIPHPFPQLF